MAPARLVVAALFAVALAACSSGNVFSLEVGTCYQMPEGDTELVSDVEIIDCDEPHDLEVFHTFDMDEGDYPGLSSVQETAAQDCTTAFTEFVGIDYMESKYDFASLYPTEDTWASGDREVVCSIGDPAGNPVTGTLEGAAA